MKNQVTLKMSLPGQKDSYFARCQRDECHRRQLLVPEVLDALGCHSVVVHLEAGKIGALEQ